MRKLIVFSLSILLVGCASMGLSPDNPQLQEASQNAQAALEKAREVGAKNNRPEEFQELKDRYNTIYQQHQNEPTLEVVEKYDDFERSAYQTAIKTLQARFEQIDSRVSKLQSQLEERVSSLEENNTELKDQVQTLKEQTSQLKEQKKALEKDKKRLSQKNGNLSQKNKKLSRKNKSLRKKMEGFRRRIAELNEQLNKSQSTIDELEAKLQQRSQKVSKLQQENEEIQNELNRKLDEGDVRTQDESIYVALESRILFEVGDVHVRDEIRSTLSKIARTLKDYPRREVLVEGHTDDLPLQNELKQKYGSNWELSAQRAINVLKYLVYNRGVSRERIGAVAYGQFRPRVPNTSDENRRKNRRVEIVLRPSEVPQETRDLVTR